MQSVVTLSKLDSYTEMVVNDLYSLLSSGNAQLNLQFNFNMERKRVE